MKIPFYTINKTIVLAISYYQRTSMFFFSDQTVCVWCRQMSSNCPFFSFLARPHSRWGVIIKVLRTHRETLLHTTLTKWLLYYSATQISAAVWKVQFNEMLFYWMVGETKWHFFLLWQIQTQGLQFIKCVFHDINAGGMYFLFCK